MQYLTAQKPALPTGLVQHAWGRAVAKFHAGRGCLSEATTSLPKRKNIGTIFLLQNQSPLTDSLLENECVWASSSSTLLTTLQPGLEFTKKQEFPS